MKNSKLKESSKESIKSIAKTFKEYSQPYPEYILRKLMTNLTLKQNLIEEKKVEYTEEHTQLNKLFFVLDHAAENSANVLYELIKLEKTDIKSLEKAILISNVTKLIGFIEKTNYLLEKSESKLKADKVWKESVWIPGLIHENEREILEEIVLVFQIMRNCLEHPENLYASNFKNEKFKKIKWPEVFKNKEQDGKYLIALDKDGYVNLGGFVADAFLGKWPQLLKLTFEDFYEWVDFLLDYINKWMICVYSGQAITKIRDREIKMEIYDQENKLMN